MTTTYYIIEETYVGLSERVDSHTVSITTVAPRANLSDEVRTTGWCGTYDDWDVWAHGAYDSEASARAAVLAQWPESREYIDRDECEPGTVAVFRPGRFRPLSAEESVEWCAEHMPAQPTDEQIDACIETCEAQANAEGLTLDADAVRRAAWR